VYALSPIFIVERQYVTLLQKGSLRRCPLTHLKLLVIDKETNGACPVLQCAVMQIDNSATLGIYRSRQQGRGRSG
jgi:hypothetical protein